MTDYTKTTGYNGTMMIKDFGSTVEFWVKAGYSNFYWQNLSFNYTANGKTVAVDIDYPSGANWYKVASTTVTTSQTVTFRLLETTGTQSMGGPTSFSVTLDRATYPNPPSVVSLSSVTSTSMYATFTDGDDNGDPIDSRQIGYGTDSASPQSTVSSDRSTSITGLKPGTNYYFWARTHNSHGWSKWGPRSNKTTLNVPAAPPTPLITSVTPISVVVGYRPPSNTGGTPITESQIGYGTSSTAPQLFVPATSSTTITGLTPGKKYYFWTRARNSVGWGPWSPSANATTTPGARIKVNGVYRNAIVYVNVGGVWKMARPWGRKSGVWKQTS